MIQNHLRDEVIRGSTLFSTGFTISIQCRLITGNGGVPDLAKFFTSPNQLPDALHSYSGKEYFQPMVFPLCCHSMNYSSVLRFFTLFISANICLFYIYLFIYTNRSLLLTYTYYLYIQIYTYSMQVLGNCQPIT